MRQLLAWIALGASALMAQTAELHVYRAVMLPSNEVGNVTLNGSAMTTVFVHVIKDNTGAIVSGSVDFLTHATFTSANTVTGLHIHAAPAGTNGSIVLPTDVSSIPVQAGLNDITRQVEVKPGNAVGLAALTGILKDPSQYYANIHTQDFGAGAMRGQLQEADYRVLMGIMDSANEPSGTTQAGTGLATVLAVATRDSSGQLTSGEVELTFSYAFPRQVTFTGFHIHPGDLGATGPAVLGATLPANLQSDPSGTGTSDTYYKEIAMDSAVAVQTFQNLFSNPAGDYINAHTSVDTGGAIRAQLRPTDKMVFPVHMVSSNEPGQPPVVADAPSEVMVFTLRYEDGNVQAGTVLFDVNYRFPGAANFTAMHIHDGTPTVNGSITIPAPLPADQLASSDGFGNFMVWSAPIGSGPALATLSDLVINPENHYLNLHTQVSPGGAVRAQLAAPDSAPGTVDSVISANNDKAATTVAPGGLMTIYGKNLAKVGTNLDGWTGKNIPAQLNGVAVAIGGQRARLLYVSPTQINAEVPLETAAGTQSLSVNNGAALSAPVNVKVAATAPAIFVSNGAGVVVKNSDFSLVGADNPARAGDVIVIYATGLGQTTPGLTTGLLADSKTTANTAPVAATIGGQNAEVVYSIAAPGYVGLYQVAVKVPAGVTGNPALILKQGAVNSNSVTVAVQ
jgi:uncharacterized protein (TIGR03437 family)